MAAPKTVDDIKSEDLAWRNALQVGWHLLSFETIALEWGAPNQIEDVARIGRYIMVNA
jgi:hypothetical protein